MIHRSAHQIRRRGLETHHLLLLLLLLMHQIGWRRIRIKRIRRSRWWRDDLARRRIGDLLGWDALDVTRGPRGRVVHEGRGDEGEAALELTGLLGDGAGGAPEVGAAVGADVAVDAGVLADLGALVGAHDAGDAGHQGEAEEGAADDTVGVVGGMGLGAGEVGRVDAELDAWKTPGEKARGHVVEAATQVFTPDRRRFIMVQLIFK